LYSRRCRLALKYPGASDANRKIVVDWFNRNLPDDMPFRVKFSIIPLATELTFVKSNSEQEAFLIGKLLSTIADHA
jgi:hypothetical protein